MPIRAPNRFRKDWRRFFRATPGTRFRDAYEDGQRRRGSPWSVWRLLKISSGAVLIVAGPLVGVIPGPGGLVVFALGLLLVATELRAAARLLDWLEPRLRTLAAAVWRRWRSLAPAVRVGLIASALAVSLFLAYAAYVILNEA